MGEATFPSWRVVRAKHLSSVSTANPTANSKPDSDRRLCSPGPRNIHSTVAVCEGTIHNNNTRGLRDGVYAMPSLCLWRPTLPNADTHAARLTPLAVVGLVGHFAFVATGSIFFIIRPRSAVVILPHEARERHVLAAFATLLVAIGRVRRCPDRLAPLADEMPKALPTPERPVRDPRTCRLRKGRLKWWRHIVAPSTRPFTAAPTTAATAAGRGQALIMLSLGSDGGRDPGHKELGGRGVLGVRLSSQMGISLADPHPPVAASAVPLAHLGRRSTSGRRSVPLSSQMGILLAYLHPSVAASTVPLAHLGLRFPKIWKSRMNSRGGR